MRTVLGLRDVSDGHENGVAARRDREHDGVVQVRERVACAESTGLDVQLTQADNGQLDAAPVRKGGEAGRECVMIADVHAS